MKTISFCVILLAPAVDGLLRGGKSAPKVDPDFVGYVDPIRGIAPGTGDFSYGNVLPIMAAPRGMSHWSVTTGNLDGSWFVNPNSTSFYGIRCTFEPSPWIGDNHEYVVGVQLDGSIPQFSFKNYHPDYFATKLKFQNSQADLEFTPSHRGAIMRVAFPPGAPGVRSFLLPVPDEGKQGGVFCEGTVDQGNGNYLVKGTSSITGFASTPLAYKQYFSIGVQLSGSYTDVNITTDCQISWNATPNSTANDVAVVRIGNSYISYDYADRAREREIGGARSVSEVRSETQSKWNSLLGRVQVNDTQSDVLENYKATLYTCLYRSLLFPVNLEELDENNHTVHASPYGNGDTKPGPLSSNSGFWDAYRALYPMLYLVYPDLLHVIFKGWLNAQDENGGQIAQWTSPGPVNSMVASMSDVSMGEAIVNGILSKTEEEKAYASMKRNAFNTTVSVRNHLTEYLKYGYIPNGITGSVSITQNYWLADYAIAQAAKKLSHSEDFTHLQKRSESWGHLFDNKTKFFRPKETNGSFSTDFDQYEWGVNSPYTESGPWQYRFYTPHDGANLAKAYGGPQQLCETLSEAQTTENTINMRGGWFHEATEMQVNCWGQYAHNNQPVHHMLYMFGYSNCPTVGQMYIQKTLRELYGIHPNGVMGYSGDEDNGEMSSWFVLSTMGLYALAPGSGKYHVGSPPLFKDIHIFNDARDKTPRLRISRDENLPSDKLPNSTDLYYVSQSVEWNNKRYPIQTAENIPYTINYQELKKGGHLVFVR